MGLEGETELLLEAVENSSEETRQEVKSELKRLL